MRAVYYSNPVKERQRVEMANRLRAIRAAALGVQRKHARLARKRQQMVSATAETARELVWAAMQTTAL